MTVNPYAYMREPEFITELKDGTVKQLNPFSGTEVWTVASRGNRPLGIALAEAVPLDRAKHGLHCAFCEGRYLETPPEKSRVIHHPNGGWETRYRVGAEDLRATVAEFRRIPNLFEILSYDYWHLNYGYELPDRVQERKTAYLDSPAGRDHVLKVIAAKLRAGGKTDAQIEAMGPDAQIEAASGFFGGGHDVIVARRHFVDGATDSSQLSSSGTLTPEEHYRFFAFTVESMTGLFDLNRYARYVAVFQNWLRPAGASFDHLHKQLVAIDERGVQHEQAMHRLRSNPNIYNEYGANYAAYHNLVLAESEYAIAFAGFGHRYPTIEIYSKSQACDPWSHTAEELRGMSDMVHAMHAATGVEVPCNEEWHYRPVDSDLPMPWRVMLKWRTSTVAGFEGATKIYLNTVGPYDLRDRVVPRLFNLRDEGLIAPLQIATEAPCRPNPLLYRANRS
jgi:galactose-1-phosphate uridylyltransferase